MHGFANPAYLKRFLFSGLRGIAESCVPGGVKVESPVVTLAPLPADRLADTYRHLPRIGRSKLLTPTQEIFLSRRALAGDHRARKKLVERGDYTGGTVRQDGPNLI